MHSSRPTPRLLFSDDCLPPGREVCERETPGEVPSPRDSCPRCPCRAPCAPLAERDSPDAGCHRPDVSLRSQATFGSRPLSPAPPRVRQSALSAAVFALSRLKDWVSDREVWPAFSELSQGSCSQTPGSGCIGSLEPLSIWLRAKDPSFLLVFSPCPFHTPPPSPNFSVIIYRV